MDIEDELVKVVEEATMRNIGPLKRSWVDHKSDSKTEKA